MNEAMMEKARDLGRMIGQTDEYKALGRARQNLDSDREAVETLNRLAELEAEIASALLLPKASVTVYVRNLVAKGLVRREIDEADLRRHRLVLTAEGTRARDRALAALAAEYDRRLARVTPEDRVELQRILEAMLAPPAPPAPPAPAGTGE